MSPPSFAELRQAFPETGIADLLVAADYIEKHTIPVDERIPRTWAIAYGVACWMAMQQAFLHVRPPFTILGVYGRLSQRISEYGEALAALTETAATPWTVVIADGRYVTDSDKGEIYDLDTYVPHKEIPPPMVVISVDLTAVWFDLRRRIERTRNVDYAAAP